MKGRCPNCSHSTWYRIVDDFACVECGCIVNSIGNPPFVPKRSQPAVISELPDSHGKWQWLNLDADWEKADWEEVDVCDVSLDGPWAYRQGFSARWKCEPGLYVRALPPIVPPEQAKAKTDLASEYWQEATRAFDRHDLEATVAHILEMLKAMQESHADWPKRVDLHRIEQQGRE